MSLHPQRRIALIAGPTASGKSGAAIALAERLGGVVVNADAMQVYSDLCTVTARPGHGETGHVPHYLFGHVDAAKRYSVARWLNEVARILQTRECPVFITGGTGLYFKALMEGLSDIPEPPENTVAYWRRQADQLSGEDLFDTLCARDPLAAETLEPGDTQRIIRAISVKQATGKSIREFQEDESEPLVSEEDVLFRGILLPERELLYQRIEHRFDQMMLAGALHEVRSLLKRNLDNTLPVMKAIGVRELAEHIAGRLSLENAIAKAKTSSRRYAKRQSTWIRGQMADWPVFDEPDALITQCLDLFHQST